MWIPYHHQPTARASLIVSDRATRQSEQSDGFGRRRYGYKQPIVPPALRRWFHRLYTRGQLYLGHRIMCILLIRISIRHALNERLSEPPAGLWTCYWLLTRPLFVFGNQFTSQALSGIYFGHPHTQCTNPRMPTGTSPDHPSPRTPFSPWNQEKEG
jgi:hypothetical protein